jgi:hypothetical protein
MPTKISEKKLVVGIISFVPGLIILLNTTLVSTPMQVSEMGILLSVFGVALIVLGIRFFKKAIIKM